MVHLKSDKSIIKNNVLNIQLSSKELLLILNSLHLFKAMLFANIYDQYKSLGRKLY